MRFKQRVYVGNDEYKWVTASNQDELNDRIVKAYVDSGRILEFISVDGTFSKNNVIQIHTQTFKEYTDNWLSTYKAATLKPTTLSGYNTMLRSHLYPYFGDMELHQITTQDVQKFLNGASHLSKKYLTDMKKFMGQIFKDAIEDKIIDDDPTASRKIVIPSERKKVRQALTEENFKDIASNLYKLNDMDRKMIGIMMYTGMRKGQMLGLKWEDIDFDKKMIKIQRNVTYPNINDPIIGTTKTQAGKRTVVLLDDLAKILSPRQDKGFIIGGDNPITQSVYRRAQERINRTIDMHGATAHILRHTFLTLLAGTGVDVKTVQEIAGHADIQVTMNRYVHAQEKNIYSAGQLFEKKICDKFGTQENAM